ncbi:MAG: hypothetical protein O3C63_09515 [Cyanobacteria bacterium]|nr:hypothetical protein [Cyanobacteriota bacterium]MDA1021622.1 hypothetical protein [Cyanobacteriota bacterium]
MINNQVTEQQSTITSARPKSITQSDDVAGSAAELATLRTKAQQLEQGIATTEVKLSSVEIGAITDKKLTKEIETMRKELTAKLTVFDGLRAQIEQLKPEVGGDKLVAQASDNKDFAETNRDAYANVLKFFAQETKEMIGENPERGDLLKMSFLNQAKAGKEGAAFWAQESDFWTKEMEAGAPAEAAKAEIAELYDMVFQLENQVSDLMGSGKKGEQESAKSELDGLKSKISALRSQTST